MDGKAVFVLSLQALFVQVVMCIGPYNPVFDDSFNCFPFGGVPPFDTGFGPLDGPYPGCGFGPLASSIIAPPPGIAAGYNGLLPISVAPPTLPQASLSVLSENVIEGVVKVVGQLPFISSIAMSGEFPTTGTGEVAYGCGDTAVIINEAPGIATVLDYAPIPYNFDDVGYRTPGCGFGPYH
ncbi:chorion class CB protein PC404-like [Bombyx mandarina]|uniref:Chorion class CB protein PC404-like n=1 Tax=Bombyx mandarina TaxID=7092 RepID=A0A6J2JJP5_BOMMA|nr:chorion class CB protein PC404-like [Bombyx mandarina]